MNLLELIFGVRAEGEKLPESVSFKSLCINERPDFFTWCRELNVSTRTNSLAMYYIPKTNI
jgi:hypothetical protein